MTLVSAARQVVPDGGEETKTGERPRRQKRLSATAFLPPYLAGQGPCLLQRLATARGARHGDEPLRGGLQQRAAADPLRCRHQRGTREPAHRRERRELRRGRLEHGRRGRARPDAAPREPMRGRRAGAMRGDGRGALPLCALVRDVVRQAPERQPSLVSPQRGCAARDSAAERRRGGGVQGGEHPPRCAAQCDQDRTREKPRTLR
mmetsp:Transcript_6963/g.20216  ORF Transcript_6963/g.20216 Transcript_6963/m.20216 type:complete len:205 (-) Transcript_6963:70-684(-)